MAQEKPHVVNWVKILRPPEAIKDRYLLAEALRRPRLLVPPRPKRVASREPERG